MYLCSSQEQPLPVFLEPWQFLQSSYLSHGASWLVLPSSRRPELSGQGAEEKERKSKVVMSHATDASACREERGYSKLVFIAESLSSSPSVGLLALVLFVAIVGIPGQVVWGKSCGVTGNMEGRSRRGPHMAIWRAGPPLPYTCCLPEPQPAHSRGKPKHLSQHLRIHLVAPATRTFSISGPPA